MIRLLFLGEITGRPGITALKKGLASLKTEYEIDYTIANGEGMTNGFGIGKAHSIQLGKFIPKASFILRPVNYPPMCPGHGIKYVTVKNRKLMIINLQGNSGFARQSIQNAFYSIDSILKKAEENGDGCIPIVLFHAAMSAEKKTMKFFLDGRVSAVIGTHTKVLTADECVTDKGTAYITDNGRVGSFMSVSGFDPETEIKKLRTQIPVRSQECWNDGIIEGVVVDINEESGKAERIERIAKHVEIVRPEEKDE